MGVAHLFAASAFSYPLMPQWFWQQSSQGLLGQNVSVDRELNGFRIVCWRMPSGAQVGFMVPAYLTVGQVKHTDVRQAWPGLCKQLSGG